MRRVIAVANQKGGVGKTTTCVNLCAALAEMQHQVLLVDMDPQGNATVGCGIDATLVENSLCEVLLNECTASEALRVSENLGFDVLPANSDLTAAEVGLINESEREWRLKQALQSLPKAYDYVIVDCPPSLNVLTLNALVAATGVLIPMQCEYYALEGLAALLSTVEQVRESLNPELEIEGVLRVMYDARNNLSGQVSEQLIEHFGDKVYRTIVPRNVRVAEAPSHGLPVLHYDATSRGALAYLGLAGEMIRRQR